jgi:hypothetical protein
MWGVIGVFLQDVGEAMANQTERIILMRVDLAGFFVDWHCIFSSMGKRQMAEIVTQCSQSDEFSSALLHLFYTTGPTGGTLQTFLHAPLRAYAIERLGYQVHNTDRMFKPCVRSAGVH